MTKTSYIVIEGNIGAGKTSLSSKISEEYGARLILEQFADNPFLPKFYQQPEQFAFQLELSFLVDRYNQLRKQLSNRELFESFTVADYHFVKSLIFSKATLKDEDYNLYRKIFSIIYSQLPRPDIFVYLYADTDKLLENIGRRGRNFEESITADYLNRINKSYFDFFRQSPDYKFVVIDVNSIDFVNIQSDYERIKQAIFESDFKKGINRVLL